MVNRSIIKTFLLNPNCSELVTYLGITEIEDIKHVLKDICNKFNYEVKLKAYSKEEFKPLKGFSIDLEKLNINKDINVLTYDSFLLKESLIYDLEENLITEEFYQKHKEDEIQLKRIIASKHNLQEDNIGYCYLALEDQEGNFVTLNYTLCPDYDETPGLSLQASQHCITEEFPILGNVYLMAPDNYNYYAFDGGSTNDFEIWLGVKNPELIDKKKKSLIYKFNKFLEKI
ncbi:MAG: hypothetical protein AB1782_12960 [Cyanobacteriota bacterium]